MSEYEDMRKRLENMSSEELRKHVLDNSRIEFEKLEKQRAALDTEIDALTQKISKLEQEITNEDSGVALADELLKKAGRTW